jgi:hypothetical protein
VRLLVAEEAIHAVKDALQRIEARPSPGADVAGVPAQMWQGSRCRCARGGAVRRAALAGAGAVLESRAAGHRWSTHKGVGRDRWQAVLIVPRKKKANQRRGERCVARGALGFAHKPRGGRQT